MYLTSFSREASPAKDNSKEFNSIISPDKQARHLALQEEINRKL
jgi:hypothetical protein